MNPGVHYIYNNLEEEKKEKTRYFSTDAEKHVTKWQIS